MSLSIHEPFANPTTGGSSGSVRPITEGTQMIVANTSTKSSGLGSLFEGVSETFSNGANTILNALVDREADRISGGAENTVDSTGDPFDNPQSVVATREESFFSKYKTELAIGAAVVSGLVFIVLVRK